MKSDRSLTDRKPPSSRKKLLANAIGNGISRLPMNLRPPKYMIRAIGDTLERFACRERLILDPEVTELGVFRSRSATANGIASDVIQAHFEHIVTTDPDARSLAAIYSSLDRNELKKRFPAVINKHFGKLPVRLAVQLYRSLKEFGWGPRIFPLSEIEALIKLEYAPEQVINNLRQRFDEKSVFDQSLIENALREALGDEPWALLLVRDCAKRLYNHFSAQGVSPDPDLIIKALANGRYRFSDEVFKIVTRAHEKQSKGVGSTACPAARERMKKSLRAKALILHCTGTSIRQAKHKKAKQAGIDTGPTQSSYVSGRRICDTCSGPIGPTRYRFCSDGCAGAHRR